MTASYSSQSEAHYNFPVLCRTSAASLKPKDTKASKLDRVKKRQTNIFRIERNQN